MKPLQNLLTALDNLRVNKLRSMLTMLGVIIGVGSVIVMVSIVEGARSKVVEEFQRLGSDLIIIAFQPDREELRRNVQRTDNLTMDDVRAIQAECNLVARLTGEMPVTAAQPAHFADREIEVSPIGVMPAYPKVRNVEVARGRFVEDSDLENWSKVCVIGEKVRAALFHDRDPLGEHIEVSGVSLTVIGVLAPKGRSGDQDVDKTLLAPLTTVQKRFIGRDIVGVIWAEPINPQSLQPALDQIWQTLMRMHNNAPGFKVDSMENIANAINRILSIFGLVMGGIAGLALLVGGIGIMNIMLVSVTERTREIGLRKAVGARRSDILWQFLIESATVSGVGGAIGIICGAGLAKLISIIATAAMKQGGSGVQVGPQPGLAAHLPLWAVLGAFVFSAAIGLFFGIYPAMRASRLHPIEALRHE
jgi:ABC-type antimicrobial peptide transport system permease subunit